METAREAVHILILLCVLVSGYTAYVINDQLDEKEPPNAGVINTKVSGDNNLPEATAFETTDSEDNVNSIGAGNSEEMRTVGSHIKLKLKNVYHRNTVGRDSNVMVRKGTKRDTSGVRVQIRYSLGTYLDYYKSFNESRGVQDKLDENNGEYEKDTSSPSFAGTNVILRIGQVSKSNNNAKSSYEENINVADDGNTTLPPLVSLTTFPDCTAQETGLRCWLRKAVTVLLRLAIFCVVIPPLILCLVRIKTQEKFTGIERESGNTIDNSEDKKQFLVEMTREDDV